MPANEQNPPRAQPRLIAAPKPRQVYWCDFPKDAQLPEFWKTRPVIVISAKAKLYGHVTIVPTSSKAQPDNKNAVVFKSVVDGSDMSWAICDHVTTLAVSRLSPPERRIPKVADAEFQKILHKLHALIPMPKTSRP